MALNPERVGTVYPAYRYEVSREKIREYATALGERDARFFSDGPDCIAPPTFAACFTLAGGVEATIGDPDLGAHPRMVHGAQRFSFGPRALRPGDRLICTPRITDIRVRGRNEFLVLEVDCRFEESEELGVLSETTLVFLGPIEEHGEDREQPEAGR